MTLATHAIVGAAAAELFPTHPVVAFMAAFLSHLAIDTIPHWDYRPLSIRKDSDRPMETDMEIGNDFWKDLVRIASDAIIGLAISLLIFTYFFPHVSPLIIIIGVIAGILPDPLQFIYWKTRSRILLPLQKFHIRLQKGRSLHVKPWIGLSLQLIVVIVICAVVIAIKT